MASFLESLATLDEEEDGNWNSLSEMLSIPRSGSFFIDIMGKKQTIRFQKNSTAHEEQ